jgi:MATE family multidrug resistance protein
VLGVVVSIPSMALVEVACSRALPAVGVRPEVIELVLPYVRTENFSLPFLLVFVAVRRYLQSVGGERAVMFALITANAVNVLGNWLLIDGNLGFPRLETVGSALATVGARIYMAAVVIVAVVLREGTDAFHGLRRWESARLRRLLSLGLPAAIHTTLEVGIFSLMTAVAGRFPTGDLAGHQVAITIIGTVFMIPLGISSAAAVRVGHAVGRRDPRGIRSAGWATLLTTAVAMTCASLLFAALSNSLVRMFTDEPSVIAAAVGLLWLAVAFQLFDGAQVATTGLLRGAGNTKAPMAYNLLAHWAIGLPVGLWLGVGRNWSVYGLWIGLYAGLVAASFALVATWYRLMRRIRRDPGAIDQIANSSQAVMDLGSPQEDPVAEPMRRAPAGV